MGSVDALGRWLVERPKGDLSEQTKSMQIRLDQKSYTDLSYLAARFGMPKATLAQELLRAAVKDVLQQTPGNAVADPDTEALTEGLIPEGARYHDYGIVHEQNEEEE
jgi:hypothetical protein